MDKRRFFKGSVPVGRGVERNAGKYVYKKATTEDIEELVDKRWQELLNQ